MIGVAKPTSSLGGPVDADLDTLATALYVRIDDLLKAAPQLAPVAAGGRDRAEADRRRAGHPGGDAGPARLHLRGPLAALRPQPICASCFRTCPSSPATTSGCGRRRPTAQAVHRVLATDTDLWTDDVWVVDSTPVECGRSRETAKRSDLAGWAGYGYCASHSRSSGGCGCTWSAPCTACRSRFALANAKADEREVLLGILVAEPDLSATRPG